MSETTSGEGDVNDVPLDQRKLTAEVLKLETEVEHLRRPLAHPTGWSPLLVAAIGVVSLVLQWQTSEWRLERAENEADQVEDRLQTYRVRFLRDVVGQFDRTAAAVISYSPENWRQVVVLRDGNRAVQELLTLMLNVGLLPPSLTDDLESLRTHYAQWLEAYRARFPDGIPGPHEQPVFVGTFPSASEQVIRRCLRDLEAGAVDCQG